MTLREYAASPALAAGTDAADIARFAADWERLLYGPDRPLRADSLEFLRRALRLARRLQFITSPRTSCSPKCGQGVFGRFLSVLACHSSVCITYSLP